MKKTIFSTLSILFIALIVYVVYQVKLSSRNAVELLISKKKMINILVAGGNAYKNNMHSFYAVISINPENNRIGITFIPPDLEVDLEHNGTTTRLRNVEMSEFENLSAALSRTLNLKIPFYVTLYDPDVVRTVDLLEGIDLYVLDKVQGISGLESGLNYMDGSKIVQYINNVEADSIFKKYDRIQDILYTLYDNRNKYETFMNADFIAELSKKIQTNMLPQEMLAISMLLKNKGELLCMTLPGQFSTEGEFYLDEVAHKMYESKFLKRLVFSHEITSNIKVKILNGTPVSGLAKKLRNSLVREGVAVVEFGTSPYPSVDRTVIIDQEGNAQAVAKISELIGVNNIYHIIDTTQLHSVLIILGRDLVK